MRTQTGGTRWPCPGDTVAWPSLPPPTVLRAGLYISVSKIYSLDYQSMKNKKRGDSDLSPCGMVARELSCGVGRVGRSGRRCRVAGETGRFRRSRPRPSTHCNLTRG